MLGSASRPRETHPSQRDMVPRPLRSPSCVHAVIGPARYAAISGSRSAADTSTGIAAGGATGFVRRRVAGSLARADQTVGDGSEGGLTTLLVYYCCDTVPNGFTFRRVGLFGIRALTRPPTADWPRPETRRQNVISPDPDASSALPPSVGWTRVAPERVAERRRVRRKSRR
jgi:hypothetical protein